MFKDSMHACVLSSDVKSLIALIKLGHDVNDHHFVYELQDETSAVALRAPLTKLTPLHVAAIRNDIKCGEILIRNGARLDLQANSTFRLTALDCAIALHRHEFFGYLVDKLQSRPSLWSAMSSCSHSLNPLEVALIFGNLQASECLVTMGVRIEDDFFAKNVLHTFLVAFIGQANVALVDLLVRAGLCPLRVLLHVFQGHEDNAEGLDVVAHLISLNRFDLNGLYGARKQSLLTLALKTNKYNFAELLIRRHVDLSQCDLLSVTFKEAGYTRIFILLYYLGFPLKWSYFGRWSLINPLSSESVKLCQWVEEKTRRPRTLVELVAAKVRATFGEDSELLMRKCRLSDEVIRRFVRREHWLRSGPSEDTGDLLPLHQRICYSFHCRYCY